MDTLTGQFLIASPSLLDPNFHRTVVFVTAHSEEGAIGLILNRRSDATVGDAVPQLAPVTDLDDPVFVGGPGNPGGVAAPPASAGARGIPRASPASLSSTIRTRPASW